MWLKFKAIQVVQIPSHSAPTRRRQYDPKSKESSLASKVKTKEGKGNIFKNLRLLSLALSPFTQWYELTPAKWTVSASGQPELETEWIIHNISSSTGNPNMLSSASSEKLHLKISSTTRLYTGRLKTQLHKGAAAINGCMMCLRGLHFFHPPMQNLQPCFSNCAMHWNAVVLLSMQIGNALC